MRRRFLSRTRVASRQISCAYKPCAQQWTLLPARSHGTERAVRSASYRPHPVWDHATGLTENPVQRCYTKRQITSQSAPSGNKPSKTTSKEPGNRPPSPWWEVPYRGAQVTRGEAFLPLRAPREAAQRVNRKGSDRPVIPRCRGRRLLFAALTPS